MQFGVRISKETATLTSVPKGYGKPGFIKRLPAVIARRPKSFIDRFFGLNVAPGRYTVTIDRHRNGPYIVGETSFGNRSGKKHDGPDEVVYKSKILINRDTGVGIRLCFIPDELIGKRVSVIFTI